LGLQIYGLNHIKQIIFSKTKSGALNTCKPADYIKTKMPRVSRAFVYGIMIA